MKQPYENCPSYDSCSCNRCPLDPDIDEKAVLPKEDKCTATKRTRLNISRKYPKLLKYKGLTGREYNGYKNMDVDIDSLYT